MVKEIDLSIDALLRYVAENGTEVNAFSALASAFAAVLALGVSGISLWLAQRALAIQRTHNRLSVLPVPEVTVADFEGSIRVKIRNHGVGPLMIIDVQVGNGESTSRQLVEWMPVLRGDMCWSDFAGDLRGRCLPPGQEIRMLLFEGDTSDQNYVIARDECRRALSVLTVNVEYTDVYGSHMKPVRKRLDWLGRHFAALP